MRRRHWRVIFHESLSQLARLLLLPRGGGGGGGGGDCTPLIHRCSVVVVVVVDVAFFTSVHYRRPAGRSACHAASVRRTTAASSLDLRSNDLRWTHTHTQPAPLPPAGPLASQLAPSLQPLQPRLLAAGTGRLLQSKMRGLRIV